MDSLSVGVGNLQRALDIWDGSAEVNADHWILQGSWIWLRLQGVLRQKCSLTKICVIKGGFLSEFIFHKKTKSSLFLITLSNLDEPT